MQSIDRDMELNFKQWLEDTGEVDNANLANNSTQDTELNGNMCCQKKKGPKEVDAEKMFGFMKKGLEDKKKKKSKSSK